MVQNYLNLNIFVVLFLIVCQILWGWFTLLFWISFPVITETISFLECVLWLFSAAWIHLIVFTSAWWKSLCNDYWGRFVSILNYSSYWKLGVQFLKKSLPENNSVCLILFWMPPSHGYCMCLWLKFTPVSLILPSGCRDLKIQSTLL